LKNDSQSSGWKMTMTKIVNWCTSRDILEHKVIFIKIYCTIRGVLKQIIMELRWQPKQLLEK
jgi:hypothetical protein